MSARKLISALALVWGFPASAQELSGTLCFHGGDHLQGDLLGIDAEAGTLAWRYPGTPGGHQVRWDSVSHVLFASGAEPLGPVEARFAIDLVNGDRLTGIIADVTETDLHLERGMERPLGIPWAQISGGKRLYGATQLVYQGPNDAKEWKVGYRGQNWTYDEGMLTANSYSSTGKDLELPERARIELDVSRRNDPTLNLFLCADNPRNGGDNYYYLQITPNVINCQRYMRDHPRTYINLVKLKEDAESKNVVRDAAQLHVAIEIDRVAKTIALYFNDRLYAVYQDPSHQSPAGGSVILASYSSGQVRASAIRVFRMHEVAPDWRSLEENQLQTLKGESISWSVERLPSEAAAFRTGNVLNKAASSGIEVYTRDGSYLGGSLHWSADNDTISLKHDLLGEIDLAPNALAGLLFPRKDAPRNPGQGYLQFKNGDHLSGRPLSWDPSGGLLWQVDSHSPWRLPTEAIKIMHLPERRETALEKGRQIVEAILKGGDRLHGHLTQWQEGTLTLAVESAASIVVPQAAMESLRFHHTQETHYHGPTPPLVGWEPSSPESEWGLDGDALVSEGLGGIGKRLTIPDRGRLDFTLGWDGPLNASIALFCQDLSTANQPGSYRLHCENRTLTLYRGLSKDELDVPKEADDPLRNLRLEEQLERFHARYGGGASRRIGSPVTVPYDVYKRTRQITLCWDRADGRIICLLDGDLLQEWVDPKGLVPPNGGVVLYQHGQTSTTRVANIHLRDWNGVLPEILPETASQHAQILLRNQDTLQAETLTLAANEAPIQLNTPLGTFALPLDRVEAIRLPDKPFKVISEPALAIEGFYQGRGSCRFFLHQLATGKIEVSSPFFGRHQFPLGAFRKLHWDLRDQLAWESPPEPWPQATPRVMRRALIRGVTKSGGQ